MQCSRQSTGVLGVFRIWCVVTYSSVVPVFLVRPWISSSGLSGGMSPFITFFIGTDVSAMRPGVDGELTPASRRLFLHSTISQ